MNWVKYFVAGFVSTLLFHQGLMWALHAAGVSPIGAWSMASTPPLGVPAVVSLAFWGGIWALLLAPLLRRSRGAAWWAGWAILGAIGPSAVALLIVFPLKGMAFAGGWDPKLIIGALVIDAVWGLGAAVLLRVLRTR